jgi:hypothetical protein
MGNFKFETAEEGGTENQPFEPIQTGRCEKILVKAGPGLIIS